jgi:hypothetical protein
MFSIGLKKGSKLAERLAADPGLDALRQQSVFDGNRRCPSQLSAAESSALLADLMQKLPGMFLVVLSVLMSFLACCSYIDIFKFKKRTPQINFVEPNKKLPGFHINLMCVYITLVCGNPINQPIMLKTQSD